MVTHRILLMTVSFFISWAPFAWLYLVPLFGIQEKGPARTIDVIPLLIVRLGSAIINPLVYVFGNSEVRNLSLLLKGNAVRSNLMNICE